MATKKDLVEAHAFSRRRLVTAFLSGAPGGREVEPSRPGRTIVGGIALSVLLVAGAAIASVLAARTPEDWNQRGLILSRENAALYVILQESDPPVLHPVINATSAQLMFGANASATIVSRETVDQQTPGTTLGIFGAPQTLPTTSDLIQSGWTACTGDGLGIQVDLDVDRLTTAAISSDPQSEDPEAAYVVRTADQTYLIATGADGEDGRRARYYPLPDSSIDVALAEVGLGPTDEAIDVPGDWLRLFEPGGALQWSSFGIEDPGGPLPADLTQALGTTDARIGDYIPAPEGSDEPTTVLTGDGPLQLDPFAAAVYAATTLPTTGAAPSPLAEGTTVPRVGFAARNYLAAGWPDGRLTQPPVQPCAVLTPVTGERPAVQLGVDPQGVASAADVTDPEARQVEVQPGYGAFVFSGEFADATSSSPWVIDAKGGIYALADQETIGKLGYGGVAPIVVPSTWIALFEEGVSLSTTAALCPPDEDGDSVDLQCGSLDASDDTASDDTATGDGATGGTP